MRGPYQICEGKKFILFCLEVRLLGKLPVVLHLCLSTVALCFPGCWYSCNGYGQLIRTASPCFPLINHFLFSQPAEKTREE